MKNVVGDMVRRMFTGFQPMNRLDGTAKSPGWPSSTTTKDSTSAKPSLPSPTIARQRRFDYDLNHTSAHFVPSQSRLETSLGIPSSSRKRSFDTTTIASDGSQSQRTHNSGLMSIGQNSVPELRGTPGYLNTRNRRKRPRTSAGSPQVIDDDPIVVDDVVEDEVQLVPSLVKQDDLDTTSMESQQARYSMWTSPRRRGRFDIGSQVSDTSPMQRRGPRDSPDHLALPASDRTAGPRYRQEMRGHIKPSRFVSSHDDRSRSKMRRLVKQDEDAALKAYRETIGSGLQLRRAVSGMKIYEDSAEPDDHHLMLSLSKMSFILHPTTRDGAMPAEVEWCTVNLDKVLVVETPERAADCQIVYILRSADASTSSSAVLVLEFVAPEHVDAFIRWCSGHKKPFQRNILTKEKLGKKLDRKWSEAQEQQNQQNQAARKNPKPDDVALIEHNLARQSKVTAKPIEADVEKRPKLKDTMSTVGEEIASADPYDVSSTLQSSPRRTTRTTRAMFVPREPSPILPCAPSWTSQNPDWSDRWRNSVLYPAVGKDRAVVDKVDIERLDEGEFLNDNLIIFYLRYLQLNQEARNKDLAERIHFHNTFFFEKLKPTKSGAGINYDSVKGWTAKVDLFSKDFIVVPINEHSHWYVAIICNAPKLLKAEVPEDAAAAKAEESQEIGAEKPPREAVPGANPPSPNDRVVSDLPHRAEAELAADMSRVRVRSPTTGPGVTDDGFRTQPVVTSASSRKKSGKRKSTGFIRDPTQLRIITLDSLSSPHSPACGYLKQYLLAELKDKKNMVVADPGKVGLTARQLPVQQNFCDCGLYLLGYVKKFLEDPDAFVRSIMGQGDIVWDLDPSALRNEIRELLLKLQDEQQKQEDDEAERKRRKREASKAKHEQAMGNSKSHSPVATDKVSDSSGLESASNPGEPPAPAIQASGKAVDTSQILRSTEAVSPEPCGLHHLNHERAVILDSQESVQEIPPMPLQKNRALSADREGQFVNTEEAFVDVLPDSPTESTTPSPKNKRKVSPDVQKQSYSATTGTTNGASEEPKRQKRIEVSLPRAPGAFEMQSTELRSKRSSDRHKNEEASRYFAGKRTGDRTGTARLRQVASNKAQQSDVIELGSDSE